MGIHATTLIELNMGIFCEFGKGRMPDLSSISVLKTDPTKNNATTDNYADNECGQSPFQFHHGFLTPGLWENEITIGVPGVLPLPLVFGVVVHHPFNAVFVPEHSEIGSPGAHSQGHFHIPAGGKAVKQLGGLFLAFGAY